MEEYHTHPVYSPVTQKKSVNSPGIDKLITHKHTRWVISIDHVERDFAPLGQYLTTFLFSSHFPVTLSPQMNFPSVSTKNTKQEILKAYSELLNAIKKGKVSSDPTLSQKTTDQPGNFRVKVMARVDEIEKEVENKKLESEDLSKKIEELKNTLDLASKVQLSLDKLKSTENKISEETNAWEIRKKQLEKEVSDESEWQKTRLEKELEQKKWEFQNELDRKTKLFEEEKILFKTKVKEYEDLRLKVKEIPNLIENEKKEIEKEIEGRIAYDFEVEQKLAKQQFDSDKKLLEQKISDLESQIKNLNNESSSLHSQLSNAQQQMKDMAVAALNKTKEVE